MGQSKNVKQKKHDLNLKKRCPEKRGAEEFFLSNKKRA